MYTINTNKSWHQTQTELNQEFRKWGVSDWETNYPKGARSEKQYQEEADRTVTLRYKKGDKNVVLTMGLQKNAEANLRVLYLAIQSMRMNEKRGIGKILEEAYLQLAAPERFNPYEVLGIDPSSSLDFCEVTYRFRMMTAHPDVGGSEEDARRLNKAIKIIRDEKSKS